MPSSALLGPNYGLTLHSHQASISSLPLIRYSAAFVSASFHDPFTDIGQAVSEFGSVRFVECQEFYGLTVRDRMARSPEHPPTCCTRSHPPWLPPTSFRDPASPS